MKALSLVLTLWMMSGSAMAAKKLVMNKERTVKIEGVVNGSILREMNRVYELVEKSKKPIYLWINSPGGSVYAGLQFINAMKAAQAQGVAFVCYTHIMAASMAFQILAECDKRYGLAYSLYLWHPMALSTQKAMTQDDLKRAQEDMKQLEQPLIRRLLKKLKIDKKIFYRHYYNETLFTTLWLRRVAPKFVEPIDYVELK